MFNRERTLQVFGYDLDPTMRRRSNQEFDQFGSINKKELKVVDNCPKCNVERIITLRQSRKNKLCYKCFHTTPEMIEAKHNQKKEKSEEHRQKMRENHWSKHGGVSAFKGKHHTNKAKNELSKATSEWYRTASDEEKVNRAIKASCSFRGILVEEFDGWVTGDNLRARGLPEYKEFESECLNRDRQCTYAACSEKRRSQLTVHHKDGFHWAIDRRHDISNGVTLCHKHHEEFHSIYGKRKNTERQFDQWINSARAIYGTGVKLIVLTGVSGSGKSWVAEQLRDVVSYIPYDKTPKEQHLMKIIEAHRNFPNKPVLYDPFRKGGTIKSRYEDIWDVELVVIDEPMDVVEYRLLLRGSRGVNRDKLEKAIKSNKKHLKHAVFFGSSEEVLNYLKNSLSHPIP